MPSEPGFVRMVEVCWSVFLVGFPARKSLGWRPWSCAMQSKLWWASPRPRHLAGGSRASSAWLYVGFTGHEMEMKNTCANLPADWQRMCSELGVWLISIPVGARPGCFFAGVCCVWSARVGGARRAPRGTARGHTALRNARSPRAITNAGAPRVRKPNSAEASATSSCCVSTLSSCCVEGGGIRCVIFCRSVGRPCL